MRKKHISYLVLSDIHLGHKNNKTEDIVNNLNHYFAKHNQLIKRCDVIFLAGDVFDKLLISSSVEYVVAIQWLSVLAMYCKKNNIKLRILEGTPSHDWKQLKALSTTLEVLNTGIDFKYISTLEIEHIEDLGINVLYIPDEYKHEASETFTDVKELMKSKNLKQVDIAIMHGQFNYQLPIKLESSHSEVD
jgi:DNA repair exonuclease SbcCD nuclease subunit